MYKILTISLLIVTKLTSSKYLEGEIHTSNNWAFLARFCFLSEEGQFEYFLEFSDDHGTPNLLLYYDADDQWPAVYKTDKSCYEKEAVLHIEQNQIINLTHHLRDSSGCVVKPHFATTPKSKLVTTPPTKPTTRRTPRYPTRSTVKTTTVELPTPRTTPTTPDYDTDTTFENTSPTTDNDATTSTQTSSNNSETSSTTSSPTRVKRALKPPAPGRSKSTNIIICNNARKFRSARERWWFVALSNCNSTKGIHVKYKILMTNGPPGDYWHEHFSADEFYILPVLMAFSIAYSFLMLGIIMCSMELKSRQLLHTTYKIFVLSAVLQLFGIIVTSAAYLKYALNGVGPGRVRRAGSMFMGASETFYLLLLLLLAKGFTITRGRLPLAASVKLTVFMCLYVVTYISIFIYEANVFDAGEVLYLYESPAGYSLITLRLIAWCMFIYSTVFTLKHYPEKSNFYYPFNVCGSLWFIAGPAFILSANSYIDKWVRESVVCAVLQFITFGGHLTFLILTMPSVANKNFPYHVRTTQIGIMELTGTSGTGTIEQFGHHVYEPAGMYNQPGPRRQSLNTEARNLVLDNVVNWSLAKNVAALQVPELHKNRRRSFASDDESALTSRRSSVQANEHFDDYAREVPVQLFTVSRMVAGSGAPGDASPNGKTV